MLVWFENEDVVKSNNNKMHLNDNDDVLVQ